MGLHRHQSLPAGPTQSPILQGADPVSTWRRRECCCSHNGALGKKAPAISLFHSSLGLAVSPHEHLRSRIPTDLLTDGPICLLPGTPSLMGWRRLWYMGVTGEAREPHSSPRSHHHHHHHDFSDALILPLLPSSKPPPTALTSRTSQDLKAFHPGDRGSGL